LYQDFLGENIVNQVLLMNLKAFKKALVAGTGFVLLIAAVQVGASCKDTLEHRISPIGSICVEGEECKAEEVVVVEAPKGPRAASQIVGDYCAGCHMSGVMNAPKIGSSFKALESKGITNLLKVAKKGKNAMPRMGGCSDCTDEELTTAIQHMIDQ
jgi:cytochrome c5